MTPTDFIREYEWSGRLGGVERTMQCVDTDALYWFSDGSAHVGKEAVQRVIQRNKDLIRDETYRIVQLRWLAESADVAVCVFRFEWSGVIHGSPASGAGRGTIVLARRGASWAVVHEHLSKGETGM
jgi:ketosteroid isomerase-like protein